MGAASDGNGTAPDAASRETSESSRNRDHVVSKSSIRAVTSPRVAAASGSAVTISQRVPIASNRQDSGIRPSLRS